MRGDEGHISNAINGPKNGQKSRKLPAQNNRHRGKALHHLPYLTNIAWQTSNSKKKF